VNNASRAACRWRLGVSMYVYVWILELHATYICSACVKSHVCAVIVEALARAYFNAYTPTEKENWCVFADFENFNHYIARREYFSVITRLNLVYSQGYLPFYIHRHICTQSVGRRRRRGRAEKISSPERQRLLKLMPRDSR
jgi:hypothetical protein